jgi:pyruvate formate lyase activating enzyme
MIFSGIVKSSLIDYPGKIATVLFVPGCNYNCFYCHNRGLIEEITDILDLNEINEFLQKRQGLIDGVVISGGEPTLHDDLPLFFKSLKNLGYLTKLDSNGSNPEMISTLIEQGHVDYFAIDYKAPIDKYSLYCGDNSDAINVLESIQLLLDNHSQFEVRTTVIPQLSLDDLIQMAKELPAIPRYVLNPYRKPIKYLSIHQELVDTPPYSEKQISEFAEMLKLYQENVVLMF